MNRITTITDLEAIIGRPPALILAKELSALDDAARHVLATAPIAGFGRLDADGRPHTTLIGGRPGFAEPVSPTEITIPADVDADGPVSFVFLIPGVGETLRLNGTVAARTKDRLTIAVEQVYINCARAVLRSRLWETTLPAAPATPVTDGPLAGPRVAGFLAATPFLVVSTWDDTSGDTSPRGDLPGFVRVLDGHTLVIPDRRGNKRADTAHNLVVDPRFSAALLVPGRAELLHLSGTAYVTDDAALLADMALGAAPPETALVVTVNQAEIRRNNAIVAGRIWDRSGNADEDAIRTLTALSVRQIGEMKPGLRRLAKPLSALARPIHWLLDLSYRRALKNEGYGDGYGDGAVRRPGTPVRVRRVTRETRDAVTLELTGADTTFLPGQFYTLIVDIDGREVRRAYSATSAPGAQRLTLTVKRDGRCSSYLNDRVRAGARMRVLGPSGSFHVADPAARGAEYMLIAAGSGITPMMSIIRTVLASSPDATITLLYGNRTEADIIFARQLAALCKAHPDRLTVQHVLSRPGPGWRGLTGRIRPDLLRYSERAHYYVCGPEGLLTDVRETLTALGVPPERLHEERFAGAPAEEETAAQTMTVEGVGEVVVAAGQTLLDAGLAAGIEMPFSCTVGGCGECKVKLLRGDVKTTDAPDLAPGEILACSSRPLTEVAIAVPSPPDVRTGV